MAKRILQVLWSGHIGGSERHVLDLVEGLSGRFSFTVCFLTEEGELGKELSRMGVPWFSIGMSSGLDLISLFKIKRFISAGQFDVIHEHSGNKLAIWAYRLFASQTKTLFTIHNGEPLEGFGFLRMYGEISKLRKFHKVLCVSPKVAYSWQKQAKIREIQVVENGVNVGLFTSGGTRDWTPTQPLISVGRLIPSKRMDLLIELLGPFLQHSGRVLHIVGDGPEKDRLQTMIQEQGLSGRVLLLGTRRDLPALFQNSALFVSASQYESFGLAIAEAAAAGLPCVAIEVENLSILVLNKKTGILVPEEKVKQEFVSTIAQLLDSPAELAEMGNAARKWVCEKYASSKLMDEMAHQYDSLRETI